MWFVVLGEDEKVIFCIQPTYKIGFGIWLLDNVALGADYFVVEAEKVSVAVVGA